VPNFKYKGINSDGKVVTGLVEASSSVDAESVLSEKGISILYFKEKTSSSVDLSLFFSKVKNKDLVVFARQFSILISASVTLVESLKILANQTTSPKFRQVVSELASEVDGGARLSDSLESRDEIFSKFFVNVVRSGETSGKLDEVLNYLADELEKDYDMTSKIKGAMIYPAFVFTGLVAVGIIMMVFVVPKLTEMMRQTGGELPGSTRALIAISDFLVGSWYFLLIFALGAVYFFRKFYKTEKGKNIIDRISLKLPIFGNLLNKIYLVRFARSLNTLLVGGVTITSGLKIVAEVIDNAVYKELIDNTRKEVENGNSISDVFSEAAFIPHMVPQMIKVGEKTGRLDTVLSRIVDFYSREISNIVANLMTLMEPIIMVIMGIGVGVMVAAIVLPMYQMSANM